MWAGLPWNDKGAKAKPKTAVKCSCACKPAEKPPPAKRQRTAEEAAEENILLLGKQTRQARPISLNVTSNERKLILAFRTGSTVLAQQLFNDVLLCAAKRTRGKGRGKEPAAVAAAGSGRGSGSGSGSGSGRGGG